MGLVWDLMEGARNCVRGYARVQPREQVVLWTDRSGEAHPDVVEAFGTAVEEVGAEAVLLCSKAVVHRLKQPLQKPVLSAIRDADVILSFHGLENAATLHNNDVAQVIFDTPTRKPVTAIWENVLLLPIVGVVDSQRAQDIMNAILAKVADTSSKVAILDIAGVAIVDTAVANHLIKITKFLKSLLYTLRLGFLLL